MKETTAIDDKLDVIDLNILRHLQKNGRLTNAELATRVNLSAATCHRRTQRLFKKKTIKGVRAIIDPIAIDLEVVVMVGVVLDRSTPESFASFEKAVKALGFVIECYLIAGDYDYFLKIRVSSMQAFNRLHGNQLLTLPGVRQTRTFFVMKEVTDNAPLAF
ncbi:AsnC family transcriptional regulator (plasmid) [Rhizobium sp. NIBRBAC000502774]|nr:AsnC family transcriptional regulator [Rhizobium sp. NIBRBAC000502774]